MNQVDLVRILIDTSNLFANVTLYLPKTLMYRSYFLSYLQISSRFLWAVSEEPALFACAFARAAV